MPVAGGITLLTTGAILVFAVTGSVRGIDLHAVGAILMAAGAVLLLLTPLVTRRRQSPDRWSARSRQDVLDEAADGPGRRGAPDGRES
ncbi:hypothetical protein GCM10010182_04660 [Actinomadura cremea]|nr:hypothetical protein GCM10010182_04660 [Actinomadura cremea]